MSDDARVRNEADLRVNQAIKSAERRLLLRSVLPLIALGITGSVLYGVLATTSELREFWWGPPFMLGGAVVGFVGFRRRLAELRTPEDPNTRHFPWLFLGAALVLAGLLVPPYALA